MASSDTADHLSVRQALRGQRLFGWPSGWILVMAFSSFFTYGGLLVDMPRGIRESVQHGPNMGQTWLQNCPPKAYFGLLGLSWAASAPERSKTRTWTPFGGAWGAKIKKSQAWKLNPKSNIYFLLLLKASRSRFWAVRGPVLGA